MSTPKPNRPNYIVTLRPERYLTEDEGVRALRAFLKAALRSYGLRCTAVVPGIDVDAIKSTDAADDPSPTQRV